MNFVHLQLVEYKNIENDQLYIVAFQFTTKKKDVIFPDGSKVPVIHVKDNTYMCLQGLEFVIKKKD